MNTFQQGLDVEPTQPQGFPARWPIPFASKVPALAGNRMPTLLGWLLRGLAGQRPQLQQHAPHSHS